MTQRTYDYYKKRNGKGGLIWIRQKKWQKIAFEALEDKKGEDVCAIDISAVSVLADYFVIANGNSDSQVRALVENVEEKMHKAGYAAKETEGHRSGAWVLIDFGGVIVHIF